MKFLSILASYFDDEFDKFIVENYKSLECIHFSAEVLFPDIWNVFSEVDVLLACLISNLNDSAGYMRGDKSGIKKRLICFTEGNENWRYHKSKMRLVF